MWTLRLPSSTTAPGQACAMSFALLTTWPAEATRAISRLSARPPRCTGTPSFSSSLAAADSRNGPNEAMKESSLARSALAGVGVVIAQGSQTQLATFSDISAVQCRVFVGLWHSWQHHPAACRLGQIHFSGSGSGRRYEA